MAKGISEMVYDYKYKSCMGHSLEPIYDEETGYWDNQCPEGCHLGTCFGRLTAYCPD